MFNALKTFSSIFLIFKNLTIIDFISYFYSNSFHYEAFSKILYIFIPSFVWKETFDSPQGYPQSTVIVKKDLVNNDSEYVKNFLNNLSDSITWANDNTTKAGEYASEIGVTTNADVISKSLARANLKYIPIKDMINDYNNYYQ